MSSEESETDDEEENPFVRSQRDGTALSYPALRLRFLPAEFEEPQLFKFLNQFGAEVLNCFCVRSKQTFQSLGIAYVQFDNPKVLPLVKEECDGMLLGGRTVRAKVVQLHRPMPNKEAVRKRRLLGRSYGNKGKKIKQFVTSRRGDEVATLMRATRAEARNNHLLCKLGIPFSSHVFSEQLEKVPDALLAPKKRGVVRALLKLKGTGETLPPRVLRKALGRRTDRREVRPLSTPQSSTPEKVEAAKKEPREGKKRKTRRSLRKKKSVVSSKE